MEFALTTESANGMRPFLVSNMKDMKTPPIGEGSNYFHPLANEQERRKCSLNEGGRRPGDREPVACVCVCAVPGAEWPGLGLMLHCR